MYIQYSHVSLPDSTAFQYHLLHVLVLLVAAAAVVFAVHVLLLAAVAVVLVVVHLVSVAVAAVLVVFHYLVQYSQTSSLYYFVPMKTRKKHKNIS